MYITSTRRMDMKLHNTTLNIEYTKNPVRKIWDILHGSYLYDHPVLDTLFQVSVIFAVTATLLYIF